MDSNSASVVVTAPSFPHKQLNGGTLTSLPDKPSMEKISSLQENPFFTKFGLKSALGTRNRYVPDSQTNRRGQLSSNGSLDEEDQPEYRPGSGFVHKLRTKWSHLNAREEVVLKRASSLEDLQPGEETGPSKVISPRVANQNLVDKKQPNVLHPAKLAYRAQSIESLNQAHPKHHANHHLGHRQNQNPTLVHPLRHVDPAWMREKPAVCAPKSPRGSHIEAPDVDLARDDIIIIEKVPPPPVEHDNMDTSGENESNSLSSPPLSYREEILPNELPKPNTVQTVRNIFETNKSSLPSWKNSVIMKRRTSDTPPVSLPLSPVYGASHTSPVAGFSIPGSSLVTSPRLYSPDNHAKPILSPPAINTPSTLWTEVEHLRPRSGSGTSSSLLSHAQTSKPGSTSSSSSGLNHARERTSSTTTTDSSLGVKVPSSASVEEKPGPVFQRTGPFYDSPRFGESQTPRSPRTMASVKPTVSNKPSSPVKPLPLSTPASAATSYKKSSPVMSVAPNNGKTDIITNSKEDGLPREIFSKSKISPKREKTPRKNNYSPVLEQPKGLPRESKRDDVEIDNNLKGKITTRKPNAERERNIKTTTDDKSLTDTDRIIQTSKQTIIQVGPSKRSEVVPEKKEDKLSSTDLGVTSSPRLPAKKTPAPSVPVVDTVKSQPAPQPPKKKETPPPPPSMLYASSSDSGESDSSTPPETPRHRDDSTVQNGLRGMPSLITVSRLKQESEPAPPRFSAPVEDKEKENGVSTHSSSVSPLPLEDDTDSRPARVGSEKTSVADRSLSSSYSLNQPKATQEKKLEPTENSVELPPKPTDDVDSVKEKPIKGVSTFITNKLQQTKANPSQLANNSTNSFVKLDVSLNDESSTDSDASPRPPVDKQSSSSSSSPSPFAVNLKPVGSSSSSSSSLGTEAAESEPNMFTRNLRKRDKQSGVKQIFDSSKLQPKPRIVPQLDLTSLNDDGNSKRAASQTVIKKCDIKFIGANTKTGRSLLAKNRVKKVNISFKTQLDETFEYLSEKSALDTYLEEHPNDTEDDDVLFMDTGSSGGGGFGESSDDKDEEDGSTTPRGKGAGDDELLKSNTSLSSSGTLQSYRGRFQEDFEWPAHPQEPEPVKPSSIEPEPVDQDSMMLRPADEEDTNTWSTSSVADILF